MRAVIAIIGLLAACDAYDTDLGQTPFLCGDTAPRCPDGYGCQMDGISGEEICVREGDSLSADFDCADDSAYEPNNLIEEASMTPLDAMKTYSLDGLTICPVGDRDLFAVTVSTMNTNVELVVDFETGGAELQAAILNAGGVPISTATPLSGATRSIRAFAQNLPVGTYYASVSAPVMETISVNNYKLALAVE